MAAERSNMDPVERVSRAIKQLGDAKEVAEVLLCDMEYDSDWNADHLMDKMAEALETEIEARNEA
jgi:hypothetical protein